VWMIRKGCVANMEEVKHSQVFGHTDAMASGRSKDEQRSTGGFWVFFHLGSWVLGSKES